MSVAPHARRRMSRQAAFIAIVNAFAGAASAEPPIDPTAKTPSVASELYQTMCVRSCDGFYFPIRQNAVRENFAADANACRSACQSEARLFYFPRGRGAPATMIDLDGRKYANEANAFAFQAGAKPGCACRAAPWSAEAKERHRDYAVKEIEAQRNRDALAASLAAAQGAKASAEISAAAAREYFESDTSMSGRAGRRALFHKLEVSDDAW